MIKSWGQRPVRGLSYGLDRVLFNPGIVQLQDPRSRVFNFDPYLQKISPVTKFDFDVIGGFITSSEDKTLENLARKHNKKYIGSTSSMTSALSHFHYLLSAWRPLNFQHLSHSFPTGNSPSFTQITKNPASIFLRFKGDGVYAIDADKEFDTENVLSLLGQTMEKLLTLPQSQYEKYQLENSHTLDEATRSAPETYHYSVFGDFLMRSQLDAHDSRLPGSGMFDLKTRAVVAVRMDVENFHLGSGYQIKTRTGLYESFEREYFDMIRAAFLKYSLQVRMGGMDGIFVAFHNTEKIFGFQYISINEMDTALHGNPDTRLGDEEFKFSLRILNSLLNRATERYPNQSLRIHIETRETQNACMHFVAEPVSEEQVEQIQQGRALSTKEFLKKIHQKLSMAKEDESVNETNDTPTGESSVAEQDQAVNEPEPTIEQLETSQDVDSSCTDQKLPDDTEDCSVTETECIALSVKVKNYVNGISVIRPSSLDEHDKWTMSYSVTESEEKAKANSLYKSLKTRRKRPLRRRENEKPHPLLRQLRKLSKDGEEWDANQTILDSAKRPVVYQVPVIE
ncbi:mitochondrial protein Pet127-domain-containing protein [Geopyxis carbonaria]|nr:mitochondrial protein Pet127-domain-containing protein [Geopyxis carbonaria]